MIIAEIGQAHDGSLGIAHSFIDALADTGINAIKWQMHFAEAESSEFEPFRKNFSYEDETRFDYWQRMAFNPTQWGEIKEHCDSKGLEFMATPFSNMAVDVLEEIGVERYKVGSGDIGNFLLLEKIKQTGKPVILSSGMSDWDELDASIEYFQSQDEEVSLLQCTTAYPTEPEEWGLNLIPEMKKRFAIPIGFSDHSGDIFACLAAVALGAEIIEFHATFDKQMFGPDTSSSIEIRKISTLVQGIQDISKSLAVEKTKSSNDFAELRNIFGKSLCVNRVIAKGAVITFDHLDGKKPSDKGIAAIEFADIIGMKATRQLNKWEFLNWKDLEK